MSKVFATQEYMQLITLSYIDLNVEVAKDFTQTCIFDHVST